MSAFSQPGLSTQVAGGPVRSPPNPCMANFWRE